MAIAAAIAFSPSSSMDDFPLGPATAIGGTDAAAAPAAKAAGMPGGTAVGSGGRSPISCPKGAVGRMLEPTGGMMVAAAIAANVGTAATGGIAGSAGFASRPEGSRSLSADFFQPALPSAISTANGSLSGEPFGSRASCWLLKDGAAEDLLPLASLEPPPRGFCRSSSSLNLSRSRPRSRSRSRSRFRSRSPRSEPELYFERTLLVSSPT